MIDRDWKSLEAIAFFEREWQHAILQAKVTLATACEEGGGPRANAEAAACAQWCAPRPS